MRRLELGLFLPVTRGGSIIATGTPPQEMPTFRLNRAVTLLAEEAGFEFVLSQSKWRGYGGESGHWDYSLEAFALISALAVATSRIRVYASVGVRAFHPAVAAKMAATIDDVSNGRFGLNIVAGWNQFEYEQMGLWPEEDYFRSRYAYAEEFVQVMERLWASGRAAYDGRFFKLVDCMSLPRPAHRIPIICAGQSDDALAFTARHADYGFVGRMHDSPDILGALVGRLQALAAAQGRAVGAYALINVIADETQAAAEARRDHFIAHADPVAIQEWLRASGRDPNKTYHELDPVRRTFMGFPFVVGSFAAVAAHLDRIAGAGVTGVCLTFPDFERDLRRFITGVVPLMASRQAPG